MEPQPASTTHRHRLILLALAGAFGLGLIAGALLIGRAPGPALTASPPGTPSTSAYPAYSTPASSAYPPPPTQTPAAPLPTQPIGQEPPTRPPATALAYLPEFFHLWGTTAPTATPVGVTYVPPPPSPEWPAPIEGQTASKLSLHVIRNEDAYILEYVRRVHPRVLKAAGDLGWLAEARAASPQTTIVGRIVGQDESWIGVLDPAEAANRYIAQHLDEYRRNPAVDYWEGWNEVVPVSEARWRWFAAFEAARVCGMQAQGLRGAVGAFSYGTPEYSEMKLFLPALEAAHRCGGIFTLHEAISSRINCGVGANDPGMLIPGAPMVPDVTFGYHMLRYRFWYEGLLKPRGLGDLPLVISELAVAPDAACGGPNSAGWKDYVDFWVREGIGRDGPSAYLSLLAWYDSELRKDPYVIGTTIFTAGAISRELGWVEFDLHDMIIPMAVYAAGQR